VQTQQTNVPDLTQCERDYTSAGKDAAEARIT
jgi:hypothetical protein